MVQPGRLADDGDMIAPLDAFKRRWRPGKAHERR